MSLVIFLAFAIMAALTLIEHLCNPGPTDWWRNLQAWAIDFGGALLVYKFWPEWHGGSLLHADAMPFWLALPVFLLVRDFTEYVFHYAQHRLPALWAMHALHHTDPEMTALTANRHFWGDRMVKSLTIWPLATMLMTQTETILLIYGVVSLYNYFVHSNLKIDFGRWSWALTSPAYHRLHHSPLPEHYGNNLAALFPVFDIIFGTYRRPEGWPPCGLDEAPGSFMDLAIWPARKLIRGAGEPPSATGTAASGLPTTAAET